MPGQRLWVLLLLTAVFWMHGTQYIPAEPGAGAVAMGTADHGTGASASGAPIADSGTAATNLRSADAAAPLAAVLGSSPPVSAPDHDRAQHFWSLCLAALLAGLAVLGAAVVVRRVAFLVHRTRGRGLRLTMDWLPLPRPPELSSLCLLRI